MRSEWTFALARLAGVAALGLIAGLLIGPIWPWIAAALAADLGWQLVNLYRLEHWFRRRSRLDPPLMGGVWGEVVGQAMHLHRRKRHHKQRFAQLLGELRRSTAALPDGVIVLSAQHEILWFNRQAGKLLGLQRRTDLGLRIENLLRNPQFVEYLRSGDFSQSLTVQPPFQMDLHLAVQLVPYGSAQSMLLVRDITRQVQVEAMRKDFVANASHELRTPLTVISGYLDTLAEDPGLEEAWRGPIADMRAQARRMNLIIKDLLELSRLEAADGEAPRDHIDVRRLLERLHRDVMARSDRPHDIVLAVDSEAGLLGSGQEIESAFSNLLVNAVKYTPSNGSMRIRWSVDAAGGHFSVQDTGIGIATEHLPRITERFYRVDAGRSRDQGGSGLGLAIVKHVLQRHGGWLEVQSAEGRGSTFTCHFPERRVWHTVLRAVGQ
jgi:two-component system, OmpR family, phosphate regulon sensor histidine kinase PhoR